MEFRKHGTAVTINLPTRAALEAAISARLAAGEGFALATLNLDHLVKLRRDAAFRRAYAAQDYVCADGNPVVWLSRLAGREVPPVLTPHPGELARLLGRDTADVVSDRAAAAREAARLAGAVVVAKSYRTVVAAPDGEVWVNPTGDAHLASGGSGDVLTGLIGSFLAQGLEPQRAAGLGAWLHGRAGELGGDRRPAATPAAELPDRVAEAWMELERLE